MSSRQNRVPLVPLDPPYRTVAGWAEELGCSESTLRKRIRKDGFPAPVALVTETLKVIFADEVDAWLDRRRRTKHRLS